MLGDPSSSSLSMSSSSGSSSGSGLMTAELLSSSSSSSSSSVLPVGGGGEEELVEIVAELALEWCSAVSVARFGLCSRSSLRLATQRASRGAVTLETERRKMDQNDFENSRLALRSLAYSEIRPEHTVVACSSHVMIAQGMLLFSAGRGRSGQRGVRSVHDSRVLEEVHLRTECEPVVSVGCGSGFSLVVAGAGVAYGCGEGHRGVIGSACAPCLSCGIPRPIPELSRTRVRAVAAGKDHALFVVNGGYLIGLGANDHGQLGAGDRIDAPLKKQRVVVPRRVVTEGGLVLSGVRQAAAGSNHSLACLQDGSLYSWGASSRGQLGHADRRSRCRAAFVELAGVIRVACGEGTSMVLDTDGDLYACGDARSGSLGLSSGPLMYIQFMRVGGPLAGEVVTAHALGRCHAICATDKGQVYTWGAAFRNHQSAALGCGLYTAATVLPRRAVLPEQAFAVDVAAGGDPRASTSLVVLRDGSVLFAAGGADTNALLLPASPSPENEGFFAELLKRQPPMKANRHRRGDGGDDRDGISNDYDGEEEEEPGVRRARSYDCYGIY